MTVEMGNLPAQVSSFVGREAELASVRALVGGSRLVTLTGTGGSGKTRLAIEAAAGLLDGSGDGVWFADLAPVGNQELVAVTVADALGVRPEAGQPVPEALAAVIGRRRLLLVLDNCEHVIGACAKLADVLLRGCPDLALLATSREPLGIDGERVYRVPSMSVPAENADAAGIRASEAVRLLADRAAAQGVALAWDEDSARILGRVCRRLDGIPLAIELAAARLRSIPVRELDTRLDQRFARLDQRFALLTSGPRTALARHQTLRAMTDWSWELLTGPERTVLARLSVFVGSFGLPAAEAVAANPDVPAAGVMEQLGALVDKSLVQFADAGAGPGRYRLLETVRQYAAGQLDILGPETADATRIAHRDYYLALAEEAAPRLRLAEQAEWLNRLDTELGNLRAAIAVGLAQSDLEPGLRLAIALREYWIARGHAAEGAGVLRALLDMPAARAATLTRAWALAAAAFLIRQTNSYEVAAAYCEEALLIARAAGDELLVAEALYQRAWILMRQGQPGAALPIIEQALGLARRVGDRDLTARLLSNRASGMYRAGDHASAVRDVAEATRLYRQAGNRMQVGQMLGNLGYYELSADDLDAARRHLAEAVEIARIWGDQSGLTNQAFNLGLAEYLSGSSEAGQALFAETLGLARRTGSKRQAAYALLGLALAGRGLADPGWLARLHGAAGEVLADLDVIPAPLEARLAAQDRERLRAEMGDAAFDASYAAGRGLTPEQVLEALGRTGTVPAEPPTADRSATAAAKLTPRELDVLRLVAQGLSNADIAQRLILSEHTVHRHLSNILRKLGVSARAAAAAWAVRTGLV